MTAAAIEYRVLGGLSVVRDGQAVDFGGGRLRSLLALLLVRRGRAVSVDELADLLWAGSPPRSARTVVQGYVSQVRKALGPVLVTEGAGYRLVVDEDAVDAARFERLVSEGREEEALALWRGPALQDFAFEGWARGEIGRLEELRLVARERLAEARLEAGRHAEVVAELEGLVSEEPLRERPRALLMTALYRSGRQADALDVYQRGRELLVEELGIDPGPELQALQRAILNQDPSLAAPAAAAAASSLPVPPTPLVGRERELEELAGLVGREGVRLVTLTGPGGIGKTRLALEAARRAASGLAAGATFVPLAPISDPDLVAASIASALAVREEPGRPLVETLGAHLRDLDALLLLDNFEQVADAAPQLAALLAGAPRLRLLVTSRGTLHLAAEHVYPVPALGLPQNGASDPEALGRYEAVALFVERARAAAPEFALTPENAGAVGEIVVRLDGLPLAIELAAARSSILRPDALLARLDRRLALLTGGPRDLPDRQQTLRATIDWSFSLLGAEEQRLFARLAVFVGGCTLEAAETVCGATLDTLGALVDESLVRRLSGDDLRFAQLAVIREYALERLAGSGEADALRRAHAEHCLALAREAVPELRGGRQAAWLVRLELEHDNLRAALVWAQRSDPAIELALAAALWRFWLIHGHVREGLRRLERALAAEGGAAGPERAAALNGAGALAGTTGDYERGRTLFEEGIRLSSELGDDDGHARALSNLGLCLWALGDRERSIRVTEESLDLLTRIGDDWPITVATLNLGSFQLAAGELEEARSRCGLALDGFRRLGDGEGTSRALLALAAAESRLGLREEALARIDEGLRTAVDLDLKEVVANLLDELAGVVAASGEDARAATLLGAASAVRDGVGATPDPQLETHAHTLETLRGRMDDDSLAAAFESGRALGPAVLHGEP